MLSYVEWSFKTSRRVALERNGAIELCYMAAGFGSARIALVDGRLIRSVP